MNNILTKKFTYRSHFRSLKPPNFTFSLFALFLFKTPSLSKFSFAGEITPSPKFKTHANEANFEIRKILKMTDRNRRIFRRFSMEICRNFRWNYRRNTNSVGISVRNSGFHQAPPASPLDPLIFSDAHLPHRFFRWSSAAFL